METLLNLEASLQDSDQTLSFSELEESAITQDTLAIAEL